MSIRKRIFRIIYQFTVLVRGERFNSVYSGFLNSQYYEVEALEKFQLESLNKLIEHARKNVSFYSYLPIGKLESINEISGIKVIEKNDVRKFSDRLTFKKVRGQRAKTSGGSTGAPVTVLKDSKGFARELAATWRGYSWAGVEVGDKQVRFWGVPNNYKEKFKSKLIDFVCNRYRVSAFEYSDKVFNNYLRKIEKIGPDYFYGYMSIIKEFAQYIDENNLDVKFSLKAIITTSEVLTSVDRKYISDIFKAPVYNEYGCGEIGTIAHECEEFGFHINCENVLLEVVDRRGKPCPPDTPGEIVVTDLTNFSMPLIRYRIKDWGELTSESCKCGRSLTVIKRVYGRQYDSLINIKGEKFHGEFFLYIIEDLKKKGLVVDGVQFLQNKELNLTVKVIANENFDYISKYIKKRLCRDFDRTLLVEVQKVNKIDREPSGKLRVVKREV